MPGGRSQMRTGMRNPSGSRTCSGRHLAKSRWTSSLGPSLRAPMLNRLVVALVVCHHYGHHGDLKIFRRVQPLHRPLDSSVRSDRKWPRSKTLRRTIRSSWHSSLQVVHSWHWRCLCCQLSWSLPLRSCRCSWIWGLFASWGPSQSSRVESISTSSLSCCCRIHRDESMHWPTTSLSWEASMPPWS